MPTARSRVSLRNRLFVHVVLPLRGGRRRFSSARRTSRHIASGAKRANRHAPPRRLVRGLVVQRRDQEGWPTYELCPETCGQPATQLLYLHGGAYVSQIHRRHWFLAGLMARATPCRCLVPIYPLGSRAGAASVVSTAGRIAAGLIVDKGPGKVVIAGDSAGGGLALAVAQSLRDQGLNFDRIVLISPWLDMATDRPEQAALKRRDAMLAAQGLRQAGRAYADGLPLDDPRVSPLHGELSGLPPITVFTGTHDILNPDSHRLVDQCSAVGTECELIEGPGLPHVYPLMPTPEGRAARRRMVELLQGARA